MSRFGQTIPMNRGSGLVFTTHGPGIVLHPTMTAAPAKYWAFISYSHRDAQVARNLQRTLETYRMPRRLVGQMTPAGEVPARLRPVFLDRDELQAGADLKAIVSDALQQSRYLVVLCSPDASRSEWVNREIIEFKKHHGGARVLAVITAGEPFASRIPGREREECFPPALRQEVTASGQADGAALEPIAADLRPQADGRHRATLKLIAGMVGVGADELIQRDARRRARQLMFIAVASLAGMAAMGVLAVSAMHARNEAQAQRGEAEDLLQFMLGDLRKKLDSVGRLDVLDGVGEKALDYYARQQADRLDANSLGRRARALHLIGELREERGQLDAAQLAFQRAAESTAQLLRRAPHDPQRIFDHAQSVYWVGYLARLRGKMPESERAFREYVELADELVRLDPKNLDWQMEAAYSRDNVGVVLLETSRPQAALEILTQQRDIWRHITAVQPEHALELANTLGWIARAQEATGAYDVAIATQVEKGRVLDQMPDAESNQQVRRSRFTLAGELSRLQLALGHAEISRGLALDAVQKAQALVQVDAKNKTWLEQRCLAQANLADALLATGDQSAARENLAAIREGTAKLLALDPKAAKWQVNLRGRMLVLAAQTADEADRAALVDELKDYLAKVREFTTTDRTLTQARNVIVAQAELALGRLLARDGQREAAVAHWQAVVTRLRGVVSEGDLAAVTTLATAHYLLGSVAEARTLAQRIESTPFRHPAYAELQRMLADGAGPLAAQPQHH